MADLKTNYVDDVLDTTKNQLRKYQQIQNDDGTVSFVDVTEYTQVGTSFGARDINDTNAAINDVNGKLSTEHTILYSNYFAANVTNNITLNDDFKNYKTLFFVCNNGTAALYCPTIYPASYIKKLYESTKNTQYLGTYPSINTFIGSAQSSAFIPIADNKFKLTTYTSGTFFIIGLK
jgi:hypothetical protein